MSDRNDKQLRINLDKLIVFGALLNDLSKSFDCLIPVLHLVDLCISWFGFLSILRILTGNKHPQIKLQRFQTVYIWTYWCLLNLKQNFRKTKVVTSKTLFLLIRPFCIPHSICFNIGF